MIGSLVTAIRWDWYKLSRRRMPWILLAILLLMSQLAVWGNFLLYQSLRHEGGSVSISAGPDRPPESVSCDALLTGKATLPPSGATPQVQAGLQAQCREQQAQLKQQLGEQYTQMMLPASIAGTLGLALSVDLILLAILTASHMGAEYGWGTIRPNLVRGIGRWQFVTAKLLLLVIVAALSLVAVAAVTALSSGVIRVLAPPPSPGHLAGWGDWGQAAILLLKGWSGVIPLIALAGFAAVLTESTAAGMAITIGYYLGEGVIVSILSGLIDWFASVSRLLLAQNIGAWAELTSFGGGRGAIDAVHAPLVLLAYTLVLVGGMIYLFERRDVAGASGG
jgi:ABC-type transport system involved in multi-copper enzyme maturation permease subunit